MEENSNYQKQIKNFILIATAINYIFFILLNLLTENLETFIDTESPTFTSLLTLYLPGIVITIITLVIFFLIGKKLTGDKRKALIFAGSIYLGQNAVNAVSVFFSCAAEALTTLAYLPPNALTVISTVIEIIEIPFVFIAAYYAFTSFEGFNQKFDGEALEDSKIPLSRARSRYLAYELIGGAVLGIFTSMPVLLTGFFATDFLDTDSIDRLLVIATQLFSAFTVFAGLMLIYIAGYKPYKSRIDAMAFVAASGLSGAVSSIFTKLLIIPQTLVFNQFTTALETGLESENLLMVSGSTGIFAVLTTVVSIATAMLMLGLFFPKNHNNPFAEQYVTFETYTPTTEE